MFKKSLLVLLFAQLLPLISFAKGYEKCNVPEKWILPLVKATGGSTIEAKKIPEDVLKHIDTECTDDIDDAIFNEKLDYPTIVTAVKKAQESHSKK